MFTANQLKLLLKAQSGDDWTPQYFISRVEQLGDSMDISPIDCYNLLDWLYTLNYDQTCTLQLALIGFLDLPQYKPNIEV
ncbi:hypothetical protein [Tolypothrix sp. VBCCA 56010]|uniref:hypothetical protein n=1 Tax=Tolypothrix sp. VBCCA 56010 TaxID=3137731 RepID=UPI003D7E955A